IEGAFYIIVEGSAVVVHAKKKMALLNEGGCFGEIGKITEGARAAAIIANRHCSVLKINETMLEQLSPECQLRFYRLFMKSVLQRLASVTEFALKHLG
ncbi:MAG: cyclic nucleotide-binding domain-containing protein, partial [Chromatiales bacterium]